MADIISMKELAKRDYVIIDVRTGEEILNDPVSGAMHIELSTPPPTFG